MKKLLAILSIFALAAPALNVYAMGSKGTLNPEGLGSYGTLQREGPGSYGTVQREGQEGYRTEMNRPANRQFLDDVFERISKNYSKTGQINPNDATEFKILREKGARFWVFPGYTGSDRKNEEIFNKLGFELHKVIGLVDPEGIVPK